MRLYGRIIAWPRNNMTTKSTTIAIFNHKGGVGKTTTAVNLAACLAGLHHSRVLVVDVDPQANATRSLLGRETSENARTLRDVLLAEPGQPGTAIDGMIVPTACAQLFILPADIKLAEAEFKLVAHMHRETVLRSALQAITRPLDYVILDCPPSLGILAINALAAADVVIVPCEMQFLSLRGLKYVIDLVDLVRATLNPGLRLLGVLPTKFYILSNANREALEYLRATPHVPVFQAVVSRDVKAEEAPSHGIPLVLYAPESRAARQYIEFTNEVITLCRN